MLPCCQLSARQTMIGTFYSQGSAFAQEYYSNSSAYAENSFKYLKIVAHLAVPQQ